MIYNKSITARVYIVANENVLLHKHKKYNTWFSKEDLENESIKVHVKNTAVNVLDYLKGQKL